MRYGDRRHWVLQSDIDLAVSSKTDRGRHIGSDIGSLDAGMRLRYASNRAFAPNVGLTYSGRYDLTARFARQERQAANTVQFVFVMRDWF